MPDLDDLSRDELIALVRSQADRIAELAAANETLAAKVAELEHLFSRNSDNSSNPPSQDQGPGKTPPAKPRREPRRAKGKQKGAPGSRLAWREQPVDQRDRFPEGLCSCGQDLGDAADLGVVDRYQETETRSPRTVVTQYDQHAVACGCGKVHTATRPKGARPHGQVGYGPNLQAWAVYLMVVGHVPTHRCVQVLAVFTGAEPSPRVAHGLLTRVATALTQVDARIRTLITLVRVLCMDETPIRVGPKMPRPGRKKADRYLLIACTELYTHFLLGDRDLDTFRASVLCDLTAGTVVVHDRYQLYDNTEFRHVAHQLCCAHSLRDLEGAGRGLPRRAVADPDRRRPPWPDPRHQHRPRQRPPRDRGSHPRQVAAQPAARGVGRTVSHHHPRQPTRGAQGPTTVGNLPLTDTTTSCGSSPT